jgi:hypothetical protein
MPESLDPVEVRDRRARLYRPSRTGEPRLVNQLSLGKAPQPGLADHLPAQGFVGVGQGLQERGIVFVQLFTVQPDTAIRAAN